MPQCRCGADMYYDTDDGFMKCRNACGHQYCPPTLVPSHDKLVAENRKLKLALGQVLIFLNDFTEYGDSERDFMKHGKKVKVLIEGALSDTHKASYNAK